MSCQTDWYCEILWNCGLNSIQFCLKILQKLEFLMSNFELWNRNNWDINWSRSQNMWVNASHVSAVRNFLRQCLNLFPHTYAFWRLYSRRTLKTLWQKDKLLIMSNCSICHYVFNFSNCSFIYRDFFYYLSKVFSKLAAAYLLYARMG